MPVIMNSRYKRNLPGRWLIILLIAAATAGLAFLINRYLVSPNLTLKRPVKILLIGADAAKATERLPRMDSFVLALINPEDAAVSLISIPGFSLVDHLQAEIRISDAGSKEGIRFAEQLISELLKTKIDHYVVVNFDGFQQLVDILDGVEVNVTRSLKYTDKSGGLIATINPGRQVLTGEQALRYVRFLDSQGEIDRIARQQAVFGMIFKKMIHTSNIFKVFKIYHALKEYTQTDLSLKEALQLAVFAKTIALRQDVSMYILPGSAEATSWKPDYNAIGRLITQIGPVN